MIEDFIRRAVERAIHEVEHPRGMGIHDGKARIEASYLRRMLAMLDAAPTPPAQQDEALEVLLADHQRALRLLDDVREWIRSDVAGGACWPVDRFTRAELLARIDAELEGEK